MRASLLAVLQADDLALGRAGVAAASELGYERNRANLGEGRLCSSRQRVVPIPRPVKMVDAINAPFSLLLWCIRCNQHCFFLQWP